MYVVGTRKGHNPAMGAYTGAAWLSSARAVRCTLKWGNERNPYWLLYHSAETAPVKRGRKEGTTSSHHSPYVLGYTHVTMGVNNGLQLRKDALILQIHPQLGLSSAIRAHELGLASNRRSAYCGEYVLGSCTHRPSSEQSRG